ncbi:hypothetical protein SAMN05421812_107239 [Asanoa hainanensis]|uniref:Uncharacterized protein n=1 Tax=Asanoa hainanensis TaxID=560556 RepID=A0A239N3S6_9ACTN|nr:hypothetical protein [Asanoa hainanensis]SNT49687.1 hypothetical protein SAMN05421812_107239 [Asanoa hainanensis]
MDWQRYFSDTLISGDVDEVAAAASAAAATERGGGRREDAVSAGRSAAASYRQEERVWPAELAVRLFAPPARWGWEAAPVPVAAVAPPMPAQPAPWVESPRPDASALHAERSKAVTTMVRRLVVAVAAVVLFSTYQFTLEETVSEYGGSEASEIFPIAVLVVAALLGIGVLRALNGVRRASAAIRHFEQPYLALRAAERERHNQAQREWREAVAQHRAQTAEAARIAAELANGPRWYPAGPISDPARVDVFGGDPRRHGWASLLLTFGTSLLAAGSRVTVLDLTGQEVAGGLLGVARAHGLRTNRLDLAAGAAADLLDGVGPSALADCLAHALVDGADLRQERALAVDVLRWVLSSLEGPVTFDRLAAGVRVLRQGSPAGAVLSDAEVSRLAGHIGDLDQNEWTARQLRFIVNQLEILAGFSPGAPLWTSAHLDVVATPGGLDDRKELLDRLLTQVAQAAVDGDRITGVLVICGADHLGARTLNRLSDHARRAGVRLVLMIDQPQGDLERSAGTGGAVCIMKMYNHRDAAVAADFVGKGHKFVINQVTQQVGKTFTDGGGDSFNVNTSHSDGVSTGLRKKRNLTDSRGQTWTGTRNWTSADNVGTSTTFGRVHEFLVDPQQILGMPETAFILVDNSTSGRRVLLADGNPGIALLG